MKFALIGKKLGHSYSKFIHESLLMDHYDLIEIDKMSKLKELSLDGFNVTIPYKTAIIPYLDQMDDISKMTKAVNTVIKKDNQLFGYNTDYYGFEKMMDFYHIDVYNQSVIILGNGSSSRTVELYLKNKKAKTIQKLVRHKKNDSEDYFQNQSQYSDYKIIINTTPVGMYPNEKEDSLINFYNFPKCKVVIDLVYNPYRTKLLLDAEKFKIKAINGLYMLLMQAKKTEEILFNQVISKDLINETYKSMISKHTNIVLIGMPTSGKTTIGQILADELNLKLIDTDQLIESYAGIKINQIFKLYGEYKFRIIEEEIYQSLIHKKGALISTGGGVILNQKNIENLKHHGIIIFIDKDLSLLKENDTLSRPLINQRSDFDKLYEERYNLYKDACDITIRIDKDNPFTIERLMRLVYEYINN
jgi:shikimate dehydrogenase